MPAAAIAAAVRRSRVAASSEMLERVAELQVCARDGAERRGRSRADDRAKGSIASSPARDGRVAEAMPSRAAVSAICASATRPALAASKQRLPRSEAGVGVVACRRRESRRPPAEVRVPRMPFDQVLEQRERRLGPLLVPEIREGAAGSRPRSRRSRPPFRARRSPPGPRLRSPPGSRNSHWRHPDRGRRDVRVVVVEADAEVASAIRGRATGRARARP